MKKVKYLFLFMLSTIVLFITIGKVNALDPFYNITSIFLKSDEVVLGDNLYLDIMGQQNYKSIIIYLCDEANACYGFDVKDVNSYKPYLKMDNTELKVGKTYTLSTAYVMDDKGSMTYSFRPNTKNTYMNPLGKNSVKIVEEEKHFNFEFSMSDLVVEPDGKLIFNVSTNYEINTISVILRNKQIPTISSTVYLNKNTSSDYYEGLLGKGSTTLSDGEYYVSDVFFTTRDNKTIHYSSYSTGLDILKLQMDFDTFTIKSPTNIDPVVIDEPSSVIDGIVLGKENAKLNEKVLVNINSSLKLASATLIFSNSNESITVNVKDIDSKPYFIVPFTTSAGTYDLDYAILKDKDGIEYQFRKGADYGKVKHFDFNSRLVVENSIAEGDILSIDNSKMSFEILNKLKELDSNLFIEINAEDNPIISEQLFETIKGSNKTIQIKYKDFEWVFNGLDVKNAKQIDVSSSIYNVSEDTAISSKVKEGLVLDFADNDNLPGKCLIKLYNSQIVSSVLNGDKVNIYYYNEKEDKFEEVKLNTEFNTNGYYEFYISHNSKFVITNDKLDKKVIKASKNNDSLDVIKIALISIPCIIVIVGTALIIKNKKKNSI